MKNNFMLYFLFIIIIFITNSFNCKNFKIETTLKRHSENEIMVTFQNKGKVKCILPIGVLLTGDILDFQGSSSINFKGTLIDAAYPFLYKKEFAKNKKYILNDCNLRNDTKNYKIILPNESFSIVYNVTENYGELKTEKKYNIQYKCFIDKEYSEFCPLIYKGGLVSNIITW